MYAIDDTVLTQATRIDVESFDSGVLRGAGISLELKDPAKLSFEIAPVKKTVSRSLLSGAAVRFIKTTAANGNKLNITSKVKYHHLPETYVATVEVAGTGSGMGVQAAGRAEGGSPHLSKAFPARPRPDIGPVRDLVRFNVRAVLWHDRYNICVVYVVCVVITEHLIFGQCHQV
jgi:hypothetical protein